MTRTTTVKTTADLQTGDVVHYANCRFELTEPEQFDNGDQIILAFATRYLGLVPGAEGSPMPEHWREEWTVQGVPSREHLVEARGRDLSRYAPPSLLDYPV